MTAKNKQQPIDEKLLLSAAKSTLEDSVNSLDDDTLNRLAAIRRRAVDAAGQKQSSAWDGWLKPAGGFVTAAVLVVAVMLWSSTSTVNETTPVAAIEDIKILTDSEELDFYQDLEFYQWLAVNEQAVS